MLKYYVDVCLTTTRLDANKKAYLATDTLLDRDVAFAPGEHDGQSFMVTELMGGGGVEGVIEKSQDHRLPLDQVMGGSRLNLWIWA